jgi:hypothetical protein
MVKNVTRVDCVSRIHESKNINSFLTILRGLKQLKFNIQCEYISNSVAHRVVYVFSTWKMFIQRPVKRGKTNTVKIYYFKAFHG